MAVDESGSSTDITITVGDDSLAFVLKHLDNLQGIEKIVLTDFETEVEAGDHEN